jgi:phosphate transport system protein
VRHSDYALVEKAVQEANDRMAARQVSTLSVAKSATKPAVKSATDFVDSNGDEG